MGLLNAAFFFGRAIFMPLNDTSGEPGAPNPILSNILITISGCFAVTTLLKAAQASDLIFVSTSLALCFTSDFLQAGPAVASFLLLVRIGGFIFDLAEKPSADAVLVFGGNLLGSIPALAQPLKYISDETYEIPLAVLVGLELIGNMAAGLVAVVQTAATWDAAPTAEPPVPEPGGIERLYIPYAAGRQRLESGLNG